MIDPKIISPKVLFEILYSLTNEMSFSELKALVDGTMNFIRVLDENGLNWDYSED